MSDVAERKRIARRLLSAGTKPIDLELSPDVVEGESLADLRLPFPAPYTPAPRPLDSPPARYAPVPAVDALVVTWTVAELDALADVLTPGHPRSRWYRYTRN